MNKRIQQLAQEAGMYVDLNGNPWPKWMSAEECEVAYKKFAELIVRECVRIVAKRKDQAIDDGWNVDEAMSMAEMDLEEHFGVEE
jgi:hypothetical protein